MKIVNFILIQFFLSALVFSQSETSEHTAKTSRFSFFSSEGDTTDLKSNFELSFGQNLLFIYCEIRKLKDRMN